MQLLFSESEEGSGEGIGVIPGRVRRLEAREVPQMGWNRVEAEDDVLFRGIPGADEAPLTAYFANSFVCEPEFACDAIGWTTHDGDRFASAVRRGRTWGTQFHPEKSSLQGRRIIGNFVTQVGLATGERGR